MTNLKRTSTILLLISILIPSFSQPNLAKAVGIPGLDIGGDYVPIEVKKDAPNDAQQKANRDLQIKTQNMKKEAAKMVTDAANDFMLKQLRKIEDDYKIGNFLYYNDALTATYTEDFLAKYIKDPKEQQVIKYMTSQFSCNGMNLSGQTARKELVKEKAQEYLGYDPGGLDPKDPQFWEKSARLGDPFSNPAGQGLRYDALTAETEAAAKEAAQNELSTPGIKAPRTESGRDSTTQGSNIAVTANRFIQAQSSSLNNTIQSGLQNAQFAINFVADKVGQAAGGGIIGDAVGTIAGSIAGEIISALTSVIYGQLTQGTFIKGAVLIQEASTCLNDAVQVKPGTQP